MFINLGILLTTYIGFRFIEHHRQKNRIPINKNLKTKLIKKSLPISKTIIDGPQEYYDHYFKASIVSLGLVTVATINPFLSLVSFGAVVYTTLPMLRMGEKQLLQKRTVGHDVLFSLYVILAFATHQEALLSISVFFYHWGLKLLASNQNKSKQSLINLFAQQPRKVWVVKEDVEIEVPFSSIQVNDIVAVSTGEVIPIDGMIIEGMATIDQHTLTGESQPVEKSISEQVFASTLVVTGKIKIRVEKAGHETTIQKIGEILNNTAAYTTLIQLKGEQWSNLIAIPIVGLTLYAIPTLGLLAATTVVHSGFGNRIRVLAPLGTLSYLHLAFRNGLLIKDGRAIEELKKVDTVLFDKTGTLTTDQPEVGKIIVCHAYEPNEILTYAATAECKLAHPLAYAIVNKAKELKLTLPSIETANYQMGYGITVNLPDKKIRVGSIRFMQMEGLQIPEIIEEARLDSHTKGYSLVIVAIDQQIGGALEIQATLRSEVTEILKGLRQQGIKHLSIVSGDHQHPTQQLAEALDMDSYFYEVLPQQKAAIVEQLQKEGKTVCFVGDGINDTIAMKKANVSISLSGATSIATDTAQVVLMDGSLSHLGTLFELSHRLNRNLLGTLAILATSSIFSLGGVYLLNLRLLASTIITNTAFVVALGNVMLPRLEWQKHQKSVKTESK
jgi:Cu2+-exporting ATPase